MNDPFESVYDDTYVVSTVKEISEAIRLFKQITIKTSFSIDEFNNVSKKLQQYYEQSVR